jgi:glycosyltransferase involved in cell wall biosynthesis
LKIQLLTRPYRQMIGLARYARSLCQALAKAGIAYSLANPTYPWPIQLGHKLLAPFGFDVRTFFTTYPLAASLDGSALKHLTAQQMATLLWFRPGLHPVVVTVHDIVPFLVRSDREQSTFRHPLDVLFDRLAMSGLKRADALICVSHFTKETVVQELGCSPEKVFVVHEGVAHDVFRPCSVPDAFCERYLVDRRCRYILYVGSENPRKNLPRLVRAFGSVHEELPEARLIKIGSPEYLPQAEHLRRQVQRMGLADFVLFYEHVPDDDLALFYNLADLFVFPSLYEGFGLPPLEAMACGTPVVCSNAASLPEVAGDAAIMVDPHDGYSLAQAMLRVLTDADLRQKMRHKGLARARMFTWERTARETLAVYREVLG